MGWVSIALAVFQLIFRVWDAINERNADVKKKKTEALQSVTRGIIDRDKGRVTAGFDDLNRMR